MIGLSEKLFYRDTRQYLEAAFGLSDISDIVDRREVVVPDRVFMRTIPAIVATISDHHERWIEFSNQGEDIIIKSQGVGREVNFTTGIGGGNYVNGYQDIWNKYFAHPLTISFHTHPSFSRSYIHRKRVGKITIPEGDLNLDQSVAIWSMASLNFSPTDLRFAELQPRFRRSHLLGSEYGYRWIIDPNFSLPVWDMTNHSKKYEKGLDEMFLAEARAMIKQGCNDLDAPILQQKIDILLLEFCRKRGLIAFANSNFQSPMLQRL